MLREFVLYFYISAAHDKPSLFLFLLFSHLFLVLSSSSFLTSVFHYIGRAKMGFFFRSNFYGHSICSCSVLWASVFFLFMFIQIHPLYYCIASRFLNSSRFLDLELLAERSGGV